MLWSLIEEADLVVHCGDLQESEFLEELHLAGKPVRAVLGNNYDAELERLLPRRLVFQVEGRSIGVVHGDRHPGRARESAELEFAGDLVDVVLFGHSHVPCLEEVRGRLFLNPGSLTCSRKGGRSYAVLEVGETFLSARLWQERQEGAFEVVGEWASASGAAAMAGKSEVD